LDTLAVANQLHGSAKFNVSDTTAPRRVTGLAPSNAFATAAASTMTPNGTGFINNGSVCVHLGANYKASAVLSPTQLPEQLQAW
jgi:DeoR/GlpR family transcriptional regulator of sugar metabolism